MLHAGEASKDGRSMNRWLVVAFLLSLFAAPAAEAAGAIAVDSTQGSRYGWWAGSTSKDHAAAQALNSCGSGCTIAAQWDTGCAAFAADQAINQGHIFAGAYGENAAAAQSSAYRACTNRGGLNCQVRVWACDAPQTIAGGGPTVVTPPPVATQPPPTPPPSVPQTNLVTFQQVSSGRFMDAHESSGEDFRLVTRPQENNDSQRWRITQLSPGIFTIQQLSNGRHVGAYENGEDFRMVTRPQANNNTQYWRITAIGGGIHTLQQVSSGRFADAHEIAEMDFSTVTRPQQGDNTQQWRIVFLQ
jgi:hypothetical protein